MNMDHQPETNEIHVSDAIMVKSVAELKSDESILTETTRSLREELDNIKTNNPADFESFKRVNSQLTEVSKELEEVQAGIALKQTFTEFKEDPASEAFEAAEGKYVDRMRG